MSCRKKSSIRKRSKGRRRKQTGGGRPEPIDKALYARVKAATKRKFKVYPSAYANGWLVQEYKRRGGRYRVKKPSKKNAGLSRWCKEKWVRYDPKSGKLKSCGRTKASMKKYPYCRPSVRVNSKTPKTVREIGGKSRMWELTMKKRKNPRKRIYHKKSSKKKRRSRKHSTKKRRSNRKRHTRKTKRQSRKRKTRKRRSTRRRR